MESEIKYNRRGFYTLRIDSEFEGNYDSYTEAAEASEKITNGEMN